MADCLAEVWTDPTDYGWCAVTPDGATIVGKAPNNNFYTLDVATYIENTTPIIDRSSVAQVGKPGIAADGLLYWLETPDFDVYRLMSANIDGSGVTTVLSPLSMSPSMSFSFATPNLAYDGDRDEFWFVHSVSGGRLCTITKTGTVTNRHSPPSSSWRFHNPLVDADGGVWQRWGSNVYRVDNSTFSVVSASDLFGNAFPAVSLDLSGNGIVEDGGTDQYFSFNGSSIDTAAPSPCTIATHAFGFTPSFWTPDHAGIWYYEPGSSSPVVNAYLWGQFSPVTGHPPMRILTRDDDLTGLPSGGPRHLQEMTSWQRSMRIRQGTGYV